MDRLWEGKVLSFLPQPVGQHRNLAGCFEHLIEGVYTLSAEPRTSHQEEADIISVLLTVRPLEKEGGGPFSHHFCKLKKVRDSKQDN